MKAKALVPPFLWDAFRQFLRPVTGFSFRKYSWSGALSISEGYASDKIATIYESGLRNLSSESNRFDDRTSRILGALAVVLDEKRLDRGLRILDFGGASGALFHQLKRTGLGIERYEIVETPPVVEALEKFETSQISWKTTPSLTKYDVVILSGTLQYIESGLELLPMLGKMSNFLILDRTPVFSDLETQVRKQNVMISGSTRTSYPSFIFSSLDFEKAIGAIGSVRMEWKVPEDAPVIGFRPRVYSGYLVQTLMVS